MESVVYICLCICDGGTLWSFVAWWKCACFSEQRHFHGFNITRVIASGKHRIECLVASRIEFAHIASPLSLLAPYSRRQTHTMLPNFPAMRCLAFATALSQKYTKISQRSTIQRAFRSSLYTSEASRRSKPTGRSARRFFSD